MIQGIIYVPSTNRRYRSSSLSFSRFSYGLFIAIYNSKSVLCALCVSYAAINESHYNFCPPHTKLSFSHQDGCEIRRGGSQRATEDLTKLLRRRPPSDFTRENGQRGEAKRVFGKNGEQKTHLAVLRLFLSARACGGSFVIRGVELREVKKEK